MTDSILTESTDQPQPKKRRRWVWPLVATVALFAGIGIGGANDSGPTEAEFAALQTELDGMRGVNNSLESDNDEAQGQVDQLEQREYNLDIRESELDARDVKQDKRAKKLDQREQAISSEEDAVAASTFGGGVYVVGEDIEAGEYKTDGPDGSNLGICYYSFLTDTSSSAEILDNNIIEGQGRVTVSEGQVFESSGCGEWTAVN